MGQRIGGWTDHVTHCLARSLTVYWLDNYACQNILQSLSSSSLGYHLLSVAPGHDKLFIILYLNFFFKFYVPYIAPVSSLIILYNH